MTRLALVCAVVLAGCAASAPPATTRLERIDATHFRFAARADAQHPLTDPQAEHARRRWLEQRLAEQPMCPRGYFIDRRDARDDAGGFVKATAYGNFDVVYEGRCVD